MKIELSENKVFYNENGQKKEIHPFWLRERVDGDQYVDSITKQRLFDPTQLKENVEVSKLNLSENFLEVIFKDGVTTKIAIEKIFKEISTDSDLKLIRKIKWDSNLKNFNYFNFKENFFEKKPCL